MRLDLDAILLVRELGAGRRLVLEHERLAERIHKRRAARPALTCRAVSDGLQSARAHAPVVIIVNWRPFLTAFLRGGTMLAAATARAVDGRGGRTRRGETRWSRQRSRRTSGRPLETLRLSSDRATSQ